MPENLMIFPENFDLLHKGEELIRSKSKEAVQKSDVLLRHINMVAHSMNLIDHFARAYPHQSDDQLVVQLLGTRLGAFRAETLRGSVRLRVEPDSAPLRGDTPALSNRNNSGRTGAANECNQA